LRRVPGSSGHIEPQPDAANKAEALRINVHDLNDHPDYKAVVVGALALWSSVTPLRFEIVDNTPFDETTD
jgi:hypothetical protein